MFNKKLPFEDQDLWTFLRWNSYLSEKYKLLYVATPKVACTSLKWWFANLVECSDALTKITTSLESAPDLIIHDSFHIVAPYVSGLLPSELSDSITDTNYFRFAVVRNPYKRIFSAWQSKLVLREIQSKAYQKCDFLNSPLENKIDIARSFEKFLEYLSYYEAPNYIDKHWTPQVNLLRPDLISYTHLTQIENLQDLRSALQKHLGPGVPDPFSYRRSNESLIPYMSELITDRAAELIQSLYADDFRTFNYDIQPPVVKVTYSDSELKVALQAIEMIRGRHQRIGEMFETIQDANQTIVDLNNTAVEKNEQIVTLNYTIVSKNEEIVAQNNIIVGKDQQLLALQTKISELNHQIANPSLSEIFRAMINQDENTGSRLSQIIRKIYRRMRGL